MWFGLKMDKELFFQRSTIEFQRSTIMFVEFLNDINSASTLLQLILLADDTNVFMSHKDPDCLVNQLTT